MKKNIIRMTFLNVTVTVFWASIYAFTTDAKKEPFFIIMSSIMHHMMIAWASQHTSCSKISTVCGETYTHC